MTDDFHEQVHDLLAAIRGVATALADEQFGSMALNMQLGIDAYSRGPAHALGMAAQLSVLRFRHINKSLSASGNEPMTFPRDELLSRFPIRRGVVPDCLNLIERCIEPGLTEAQPVEDLVRKHGVIALMMLVRICNELGNMLVDMDPDYASLSDLMAREAAADEMDWQDGGR